MYDDNLTLGAILKDGELFKAYPELKTYPVEITNAGNILGGFDNETKTISLDFMLSRSTLAHEIQHALQHIEGFARGANASDKNYLRSAGEAEARNIEQRINMTPEQRRASLAAETEYVAREDQIFIYDAIEAVSKPAATQKFTPISLQTLTDLIDLLKRSNLAKEVVIGQEQLQEVIAQGNTLRYRTKDGEVYGAVKDGIVYLDDTKMNANTPIHEFGHLWQSFIEKNNPELYKKGCDLLIGSSYMEEVRKNPAYANLNKKQQVDEAMAMAIGDNGERFVNEKNLGKKNQIQKWLRKVWAWTGKKMGIRDLSPTQIRNLNLKQFIDGAVEDLVSGKKIQEAPSVSGTSAETDQIKQHAIANGTFMKASNGKPTNLTERQWLQVRTEAFKKWFGDWENDPGNASKVVDENGEPLVVYHFTPERFTAFDLSEARQNADIPAFFFSPNIDDWKDMGNNKMGVFLNITNPVEKPNADMQGKKVREELENSGYNGTYSTEDNEIVEYAAFNPSQIKSATSNNGEFNEIDSDIRHQFIGEQGAAALDKAEKKFTPITRQEKVIPVKIGGVKLSSEQQKAIATGKQVKVVGVTDKSGQKHTVHVQWNAETKKLEYTKNKSASVSKNSSKKEKKNRPKL
jgi:hypothetical protein